MDFCVSLIFFLNSKKKRGKKSGQNHKKYKIETIFDVNFEKFKMVFWKIFQRRKIFIFSFLLHFLLFFLLYEHPKGTIHGINHENPLFFKKRSLCKKCWICCKNSTNVAKKFSNIFWYRAGKKKGTMLNWPSSLNFWDMTTLILSKERIGPGKFYEIILKVRQLLVVSLTAQNQNCKK